MFENAKIIRAVYTGEPFARTDPAYQYDTGHALRLDGFALPDTYEAHFAHSETGNATVLHGCFGDTFPVPDELFITAKAIFCWICYRDDRIFRTLYKITIPVKARSPLPNNV